MQRTPAQWQAALCGGRGQQRLELLARTPGGIVAVLRVAHRRAVEELLIDGEAVLPKGRSDDHRVAARVSRRHALREAFKGEGCPVTQEVVLPHPFLGLADVSVEENDRRRCAAGAADGGCRHPELGDAALSAGRGDEPHCMLRPGWRERRTPNYVYIANTARLEH